MAQRRIFTNASRYVTPVPLSRHTSLHSNDNLRSAFCRQALCCRRLVCSTRVVSRVRTFESENPHLVQTEDGSVPDHEKIFFEDFKPGEDIPMVPLPPFDDGSGKILASPELHSLADRVLELSLVEVHQLSQLFNDHFDLDDEIAPMEMGVAPSSGENAEGQAAEERTIFDLKLTGFDSKSKIKVIKEVRSIAELGLKEAKELVEGAPKVVRKDIKKEDAEQLKEKLEAVGATVEII